MSSPAMFPGFPPFIPSDVMLESLSHTFNGEYTPWDSPEVFPSPECHDSIVSNSSSNVIHSPELVFSFQTSDYPEKKTTQDPNQDELIMSELIQRRRISNRESAKRSRVRKQKRLEKLKNLANRLTIEKRGLSNRLLIVLSQNQRLRNENGWFLSEYWFLREKMSALRQLLVLRRLEQSTPAWPYENLMTEANLH